MRLFLFVFVKRSGRVFIDDHGTAPIDGLHQSAAGGIAEDACASSVVSWKNGAFFGASSRPVGKNRHTP